MLSGRGPLPTTLFDDACLSFRQVAYRALKEARIEGDQDALFAHLMELWQMNFTLEIKRQRRKSAQTSEDRKGRPHNSGRRYDCVGTIIPAREGEHGGGQFLPESPRPQRPRTEATARPGLRPDRIRLGSLDQFDKSILVSSTVAKCIRPAHAVIRPPLAGRSLWCVRRSLALLALLTFPLRSSRLHFCGFGKLVREEVLNALWQRDAC